MEDSSRRPRFATHTVEWRRERADALSATQRKRADSRPCAAPLELRDANGDGVRVLRSYASLFDTPYVVGSGGYRFQETVKPGAFKRSLGSQPDVVFRTEHSGPPLGATWNDTLRLGEDDTGFWYEVDLNPRDQDAQSLIAKVERKDYRESSFAFRVPNGGDEWNEDRSARDLVHCEIDRGDVSVVTFGASPATGKHMLLRSQEDALSALQAIGVEEFLAAWVEWRDYTLLPLEARAGRTISTASMDTLHHLLGLFATADDAVDEGQAVLADFMGVPNPDADDADDESDENDQGGNGWLGGAWGRADSDRAELSSADANDLPDTAFAYIEPGGTKDKDGKTVPRSKRHFPIQDAAHVRNALARAPQSPFGDKAMPKIKAAAKKFGVEGDGRSAPPLAENDSDDLRFDLERNAMGLGR